MNGRNGKVKICSDWICLMPDLFLSTPQLWLTGQPTVLGGGSISYAAIYYRQCKPLLKVLTLNALIIHPGQWNDNQLGIWDLS